MNLPRDKRLFLFKSFCILFLIVFIFFMGRFIKSKHTEKDEFNGLFKEGKPFYTLEEAKEYADELIPLVEKYAGRKFKWTPEIRLIDSEELETLVLREKLFGPKNNKAPSAVERLQNQRYSKFISGLYSRHDRAVYLLPRRVSVTLRFMGLDDDYGVFIAKSNIAHELTHALQDQHVNLADTFKKVTTTDQAQAFSAVMEGQAVMVEHLVRQQFPSCKGKMEITGNNKNTDILRMVKSICTIYRYGRKFVQHHTDQGGNEKIWEILQAPPADSSMIIYPETYCKKPYAGKDYSALLTDVLKPEVDPEKYTITYQNESVGKLDLVNYLETFSPAQKHFFITSINDIQFLYVYLNETLYAQIGFFLLKDQAHTDQMVHLMEQMEENILKDEGFDVAPWTDMRRLKEFKDRFRIARQIQGNREKMPGDAKTKVTRTKSAVVSSENMIVTGNYDLYPYDMQRIATTVFRRYQNTRNVLTQQ